MRLSINDYPMQYEVNRLQLGLYTATKFLISLDKQSIAGKGLMCLGGFLCYAGKKSLMGNNETDYQLKNRIYNLDGIYQGVTSLTTFVAGAILFKLGANISAKKAVGIYYESKNAFISSNALLSRTVNAFNLLNECLSCIDSYYLEHPATPQNELDEKKRILLVLSQELTANFDEYSNYLEIQDIDPDELRRTRIMLDLSIQQVNLMCSSIRASLRS